MAGMDRTGKGMSRSLKRQQGVALLVFVLVVVMTTALALGTWGRDVATEYRQQGGIGERQAMEAVRERLLQFAQFTPDIYVSDSSGSPSGTRQQHRVPPPGYLPCPDTDGDGSPQSGCTGIAYGCLPKWINSRHIYFSDLPAAQQLSPAGGCTQPYYVVDADFAVKTTFGSLDPTVTPDITLNGQRYVALLILPGEDGQFDAENTDGDAQFSSEGDEVVGIAQDDWKTAVERRADHYYESLKRLKAETGQVVQGPFWLCGSGGGGSSGGTSAFWDMLTFTFDFDWTAYLQSGGESVCS